MKELNLSELNGVAGGNRPEVFIDPKTGELTIRTCVDPR